MSLLLLFRPRRRRNVGASGAGRSSGGGQRLRVFRNPAWMRKKHPLQQVDAVKVPILGVESEKSNGIAEFLKFQGSEVPLFDAKQLTLEAMALLEQPYIAVSSGIDWAVPDYLAECGCVLETYLSPEQVAAHEEDVLLLLMAAQ